METNQPIESLNLQEDGLDREMAEMLARGQDFEDLYKRPVYRRILAWFAQRADECLVEMRDANVIEDDRVKAQRQLKWATTERLMKEFDNMVATSIHERQSIIQMVQERNAEGTVEVAR